MNHKKDLLYCCPEASRRSVKVVCLRGPVVEKAHAAIAAFHSALEIFVRTGEKSAFHSEVMEKAMRNESRVAARRKQKQSSLSTPSKPDHNRKSGGGMVRLASELSFLSTTESL